MYPLVEFIQPIFLEVGVIGHGQMVYFSHLAQ